MSNLNRDKTVGVMFIGGILGFISGSFIISTIAFAMAAISSNLYFNAEEKVDI